MKTATTTPEAINRILAKKIMGYERRTNQPGMNGRPLLVPPRTPHNLLIDSDSEFALVPPFYSEPAEALRLLRELHRKHKDTLKIVIEMTPGGIVCEFRTANGSPSFLGTGHADVFEQAVCKAVVYYIHRAEEKA